MSVKEESYQYENIIKNIDLNALKSHIKFFENCGSRVTGYPGFYSAADYIERTFKNFSQNVWVDTYKVLMPVEVYQSTLTIPSENISIDIYPLWPNLVCPVVTPPEGLGGKIVQVKDGYLSDFNGKDIEGNIVIMNFNSGYRWLHAVRLGAKAVIFVEQEDIIDNEAIAKTIDYPINFPRFFIKAKDAQFLSRLMEKNEDLNVILKGKMAWEYVEAKNIFCMFNGTERSDQVVIFSAYFDSMSVVPSISPGAEESIGVSILLEIAKFLHNNPPKNTVILFASSGHHQVSAGMRNFIEKYLLTPEYWEKIGRKIMILFSLNIMSYSKYITLTIRDAWGHLGGGAAFNEHPPYANYFMNIGKKAIEQGIPIYLDHKGLTIDSLQLMEIGFGRVPFCDSQFMAGGVGGASLGVQTSNGKCWKMFTPQDYEEYINYENLIPQLNFIYILVYEAATIDHKAPEVRNKFAQGWTASRRPSSWQSYTRIFGQVAMWNESLGWYSPVSDALVLIRGGELASAYPWFNRVVITKTDENGRFYSEGFMTIQVHAIRAYKINDLGYVTYCTDRGRYMFFSSLDSLQMQVDPFDVGILTVMPCGSIVIFDVIDPRLIQYPLTKAEAIFIVINEHESYSTPNHFGIEGSLCGSFGFGVWQGFAPCVIFAPPEEPVDIRFTTISAPRTPIAVFLNSSKQNPLGFGYKVKQGEQLIIKYMPLAAAIDLYWLTETRIRSYEETGVKSGIGENQQKVWNLIELANQSLINRKYDDFYRYSILAWNEAYKNYATIQSITLDAVNTFPFILALLIPFSFAIERLLMARERGKERVFIITTLCIIFILTLSIFHIGSKIVSNIITLAAGLSILVLSIPLLVFMLSFFFESIRFVSYKKLGFHEIKVRGRSFITEAFSMGIHNMKRTKMQSALTLVTVVIITTSLCLFTSLSSVSIIKPQQLPGSALYDGVFIRPDIYGMGYYGVTESLVEFVNISYGNVSVIAPRAWFYISSGMTKLYVSHGNNTQKFMQLLGLTPEERYVTNAHVAIIKGRWFEKIDRRVCILPEEIASSINATVGDTVNIGGRAFMVIGIFDSEIFDSLVDLDQEPITPIMMQTGQTYTHNPSSATIILPYEDVVSLGGPSGSIIISVSLKVHEGASALQIGTELSKILRHQMWVSTNGTILSLSRVTTYILLGLNVQLIVMSLGVLVIFNTLMANVQRRSRDILIYSALGISPRSIFGLFLSESLVYAIVGGVLGYFIALGTSFFISKYQFMPFYLNYSSTGAISSICMVMATIIIASIYPLYKTSKMVTPSLERVWRVPTKPKGDEWSIPFPFVAVSEEEALGILAFIGEFLHSHIGERSPKFSVKNLSFERAKFEDGKILLKLSFDADLEPYEAGIRQNTQVIFQKSILETRYSSSIYLHRLLGSPSVWVEAAKILVDEIRKQILLWRSLGQSKKEEYINRGKRLVIKEKGE
jgi:ABC-type antimicrobial peptide transport system permease subunit